MSNNFLINSIEESDIENILELRKNNKDVLRSKIIFPLSVHRTKLLEYIAKGCPYWKIETLFYDPISEEMERVLYSNIGYFGIIPLDRKNNRGELSILLKDFKKSLGNKELIKLVFNTIFDFGLDEVHGEILLTNPYLTDWIMVLDSLKIKTYYLPNRRRGNRKFVDSFYFSVTFEGKEF